MRAAESRDFREGKVAPCGVYAESCTECGNACGSQDLQTLLFIIADYRVLLLAHKKQTVVFFARLE